MGSNSTQTVEIVCYGRYCILICVLSGTIYSISVLAYWLHNYDYKAMHDKSRSNRTILSGKSKDCNILKIEKAFQKTREKSTKISHKPFSSRQKI